MKDCNDCKIYVLHYKDGEPFPAQSGYVHLLAGKKTYQKDSALTGDDTLDNISAKNKYYSELTGIYWIWKNQPGEIVGTCHYRRFYTAQEEPFSYRLKRFLYFFAGMHIGRHGLIYTSDKKFWGDKILTCEEATQFLEEFDAVMPEKRKLRQSIEAHYNKYHDANDLQLLRDIVREKAPAYVQSLETTLSSKGLYANNMMIMRWEKFDALCSWLFGILFEFERRSSLENYTDYQQRIFGFLSERLITAWVEHQQLKVKELPLIYFKHLKKTNG